MPGFRLAAAVAATLSIVLPTTVPAAPGDLVFGFATGGVWIGDLQTEITGYGEVITALDAQGRVLVAFSHDTDAAVNNAGMRLAVTRLLASGTPDTTFNGGVPLVLDFSAYSGTTSIHAAGIEPGPGGTIWVGGREPFNKLVLARLTGTGGYDNTFSTDGRLAELPPTMTNVTAYDFEVDDSGRPLFGGRAVIGGTARPFVVRLETDGDFDSAFAGDGVADFANVSGGPDELYNVTPVAGGGVLGAGHAGGDGMVVKLLSTGAPDNGFGGDGQVLTRMGIPAPADPGELQGVTQDSAGRIVATGQATSGSARFTVMRFEADGDPDPTWGTGSPATGVVWFPSGTYGRGHDVAQTCDGLLLVSGLYSASTNGFLLARMTSAGALDTSFAPSSSVPGVAFNTFGQYANGDRITLDDGSVLASGMRWGPPPGTDYKPVVLRQSNAPCGTAVPPGDDDDDDDPPATGGVGGGGSTPAPPAPTPGAAPIAPVVVPRPMAPAATIANSVTFPSTRRCASRRNFSIRLRVPAGAAVTSAEVLVNGKRAAIRRGARLRSKVDLRSLPRGRFTVTIRLTLAGGRKVSGQRRYRTCVPKRRSSRRPRV